MSTHACNLAKNLSKSFDRLFREFTDLQVAHEELSKRLADLEEKERARSRDDHDRDMALDEKFLQEIDGH